MSFTVKELAEWVGGDVSGDGTTPIQRLLPLSEAEAGDLTLVSGEKNASAWATSTAAAAVVPLTFPADSRPLIRVADPMAAFQSMLLRIRGDRSFARDVHPMAAIHPTAILGPNASVGPFVAVGEGTVIGANATLHAGAVIGRFCKIGDDATVFPRAVVYDDCTLGHRVTLHAGAVVGADGFGYRLVKGRHEKVPQIGTVLIEDDVEVGANSCIDRATLGTTRVGAGTKIDNLVTVAHNCRIGRHNILIAQCGIAGSSTTGEYVVLAGQAGVADHVSIGDRAVIGAQSGIMSDVPPDSRIMGTPGMQGSEYMMCVANWRKLTELRRDVAKLKKQAGGGGG